MLDTKELEEEGVTYRQLEQLTKENLAYKQALAQEEATMKNRYTNCRSQFGLGALLTNKTAQDTVSEGKCGTKTCNMVQMCSICDRCATKEEKAAGKTGVVETEVHVCSVWND